MHVLGYKCQFFLIFILIWLFFDKDNTICIIVRQDISFILIFTCGHLVTYCLEEAYPREKYAFYFSAYISPPPCFYAEN